MACPATGVSGSSSNYTFSFPQPPYGHVDIAFATGHGITDFGFPDNLPFNEFDDASVWSYELIDTTPPFVLTRSPARGVNGHESFRDCRDLHRTGDWRG